MKKRLTDEQMMMEVLRAKRANYIALGTLLFFLVALIGGIFIYKYQHSFTTEKWLNQPDHRTRIVDDMLETTTLIGMTEAEIITLLGESNNDCGYFNAPDRFVYWMGDERGWISIDSEWLVIDFVDGIVSDYSITTD